jgi:hypothetical protein
MLFFSCIMLLGWFIVSFSFCLLKVEDDLLTKDIKFIVSKCFNFHLLSHCSFQVGCRGLVKGVEKFDGSRGFKFSTCAYLFIKEAVLKSLSRSTRLIQLPVCFSILFLYIHLKLQLIH